LHSARFAAADRLYGHAATNTGARPILKRLPRIAPPLRDVREGEVLCECSGKGCVETIALSHEEYEQLGRVPTYLFIVPGHEKPEFERVVERTHRYVVVETFGDDGEVAVRFDPRPATTYPSYWPMWPLDP
jgi:hypothetical protein